MQDPIIQQLNFLLLLVLLIGILIYNALKNQPKKEKVNESIRRLLMSETDEQPKRIYVWMKGASRAVIYEDIKSASRYDEGWLRIDFNNNTKSYINLNNPDLDRFIVDYNEEM